MRKRKIRWISIKRLKCHEFRTTLRKLGKESNSWPARFEILSKLESDATKLFMKVCAQLVVAYLILTSLRVDNILELKVLTFTASIPLSYFLATVSFLMLIVAIAFCHLSVLITLKVKESSRPLLSGFSTGTYGLLKGAENDVSLGTSLYANYFLKEVLPLSKILAFGLLLGLFSILIPIGAFSYFLFMEQMQLIYDSQILLPERIAVLSGMALSLLSVIYVFLFHLPFPLKKNINQIRWNFLYQIRILSLHPQAERWLNGDKKT